MDYLYNLEFCSPTIPSGNKIYDEKAEHKKFPRIPNGKAKDEKKKKVFTIYIGELNYRPILEKLITKFSANVALQKYGETLSTICGFKIDEEGNYLPSSFSISSFIYALDTLWHQDPNEEVHFSKEKYQEYQIKISEKVSPVIPSLLTEEAAEQIYEVLKNTLSLFEEYISYDIKIMEEEVFKEVEESSPAILGSFCLNDVSEIRKSPTPKIEKLLSLKHDKDILISENSEEILKVIDPEKSPIGKWPCKFEPSLMQQVAIQLSLEPSVGPIFSINGPPGTGKTTLVKEIIADRIVRRAEKMTHFENPNDAFKKHPIDFPIDAYSSSFYELDPSLKGYEIIVASNNNSAVENITLELPEAKGVSQKKALTSLFDIKKNDEIYFSELANAINTQKENWGLISVRLGKKENINKFLTPLWFDKKEEAKTIHYYYKNNLQSFAIQKQSFQKKYQEVMKVQQELINTYHEFLKFLDITNKRETLIKEEQNHQEKISSLLQEKKEVEKEKNVKEKKRTREEKLLTEIRQKMPLHLRLFSFLFRTNFYVEKYQETRSHINQLNEEILNLTIKINEIEDAILKEEGNQEHWQMSKEKLSQESSKIERQLTKAKESGIKIPTLQDLEKINEKVEVQISSFFVSEEYDRLREELFYEALHLHKSFVLNSQAFKTNLGLIVNMLNSLSYNDIKRKYYAQLLPNLFLLVPVISTTLASVERFLSFIPQDSLGLLILDEAGQATPASTLGIINRSKKAIVLGDPLQIEPVVNIPLELFAILDTKNTLPNLFHVSSLSAQILADLQNDYGERRTNEKWLGCPLLVHRRCLEPMFTISNKIAYEEKMFSKTEYNPTAELLMDKSTWLNIGGKEISKENHYVKEQGDKVLEILEKGLNKSEDLPNVYIITPFKSVAKEMSQKLKTFYKKNTSLQETQITDWVTTHCGTIHTFQGKEANEVILLLGCDEESMGAIKWAGEKPNILNVAVTRAKYHIIIIGEANLWQNISYFNVAYNELKEQEK